MERHLSDLARSFWGILENEGLTLREFSLFENLLAILSAGFKRFSEFFIFEIYLKKNILKKKIY